ncbi:MAG: hypothetical protein AAF696_04350 [Bacteroidota bacterium]
MALGQDNSLENEIILEDVFLSLEEEELVTEEEAMILERHRERQEKIKADLANELKAIRTQKVATNENLYYLQTEFQRSSSEQSLLNQEIQVLRKRRKYLLKKISTFLLDVYEDEEDLEKAPLKETRILQGMNQELKILDRQIATKEGSIPQQIDELEEMQDQIEDIREFSDQLDDLEEKNTSMLRKKP